jgi:hypothetical protein
MAVTNPVNPIRLLAILATLPAPTGPRWNTLAPKASITGRARAKSASAPPTMTANVPSRRAFTLPDTGASQKATPAAAARSANDCMNDGASVDSSMYSCGLASAANTSLATASLT